MSVWTETTIWSGTGILTGLLALLLTSYAVGGQTRAAEWGANRLVPSAARLRRTFLIVGALCLSAPLTDWFSIREHSDPDYSFLGVPAFWQVFLPVAMLLFAASSGFRNYSNWIVSRVESAMDDFDSYWLKCSFVALVIALTRGFVLGWDASINEFLFIGVVAAVFGGAFITFVVPWLAVCVFKHSSRLLGDKHWAMSMTAGILCGSLLSVMVTHDLLSPYLGGLRGLRSMVTLGVAGLPVIGLPAVAAFGWFEASDNVRLQRFARLALAASLIVAVVSAVAGERFEPGLPCNGCEEWDYLGL
jgi:hypothetical protein